MIPACRRQLSHWSRASALSTLNHNGGDIDAGAHFLQGAIGIREGPIDGAKLHLAPGGPPEAS